MGPFSKEDLAKFWSWVEPQDENGCRLCRGPFDKDGYKRIWIQGRCFYAHRIACYLKYGSSPPGRLLAIHGCRQKYCVEHVHWGSCKENSADKERDGTVPRGDRHWSRANPEKVSRGTRHGSYTKPENRLRGSNHSHAKLTEDDVRVIRASKESGVVLARKYRVTPSAISLICLRKAWKHVK